MSNPVALLLDAPRLIKRLDADKDDKVSKDEFKGVLEIIPQVQENPNALQFIFTRLDGDKDGFLTLEELKKVRQFFGGN
jgi:Ca2+-binding EF-hand superfamily protein